MNSYQAKMNPELLVASGDDIASMKARLPLPNLQYLDVAAQQELKAALARWPLLEELASSTRGIKRA
jgi:hypothetical protein